MIGSWPWNRIGNIKKTKLIRCDFFCRERESYVSPHPRLTTLCTLKGSCTAEGAV